MGGDGLTDMLRAREQGEETQFFRRWDAELLKKLREKANLDELTRSLAAKLHVDDPALLQKVVEQGVSGETGPAFLLAPYVQIAWAEGKVTKEEKELIHLLARERGVEPGSPASAKLEEWLSHRPSEELFETSEQCIRLGLSLLPEAERQERIKQIVAGCRRVAAVSGSNKLARFLGLVSAVSHEEEDVLAAITARLTG